MVGAEARAAAERVEEQENRAAEREEAKALNAARAESSFRSFIRNNTVAQKEKQKQKQKEKQIDVAEVEGGAEGGGRRRIGSGSGSSERGRRRRRRRGRRSLRSRPLGALSPSPSYRHVGAVAPPRLVLRSSRLPSSPPVACRHLSTPPSRHVLRSPPVLKAKGESRKRSASEYIPIVTVRESTVTCS